MFVIEAPRRLGKNLEVPCAARCNSPRRWRTVAIAIVDGGGDKIPEIGQVAALAMPPAKVDIIAANLWLGDALLSGNLICYLQPVISQPGRVFGYEAFARVRREAERDHRRLRHRGREAGRSASNMHWTVTCRSRRSKPSPPAARAVSCS